MSKCVMGSCKFAEVEPISTYVDFGEREFLVADERGYEHLLYKMAESFLFTSGGKILDSRLKLNQVFFFPQHFWSCYLNDLVVLSLSAVPLSCTEDREQVQCSDSQASVHEQGQQSTALTFQAYPIYAGEGLCLYPYFHEKFS